MPVAVRLARSTSDARYIGDRRRTHQEDVVDSISASVGSWHRVVEGDELDPRSEDLPGSPLIGYGGAHVKTAGLNGANNFATNIAHRAGNENGCHEPPGNLRRRCRSTSRGPQHSLGLMLACKRRVSVSLAKVAVHRGPHPPGAVDGEWDSARLLEAIEGSK